MSTSTTTEQAQPLSEAVRLACDLATGDVQDPTAVAIKLRAAHKDYNARGSCRAHWYRMVWRSGEWRYFGDGHLPKGNFRAAERNASTYGDVYAGEIVCSHDHGGPVDQIWLVIDTPRKDGQRGSLRELEWSKTRAGLQVILPTGAHLTLPNPRQDRR